MCSIASGLVVAAAATYPEGRTPGRVLGSAKCIEALHFMKVDSRTLQSREVCGQHRRSL
jgi:hypothetical protein